MRTTPACGARLHRMGIGRRVRRGAVTLEVAVLAPLLLLILFGCMEASVLVGDAMALSDLTREAARAGAKGATPADLDATIEMSAGRLDPAAVTRVYQFARYDPATGTWGSWQTLGSTGPFNNATDRDRVRVSLSYSHRPVAGQLFSQLARDTADGTLTLRSGITVRRE